MSEEPKTLNTDIVMKNCIRCEGEFETFAFLTSRTTCPACIQAEEDRKEQAAFDAQVRYISQNYVDCVAKTGFDRAGLKEYQETAFDYSLARCTVAGARRNTLNEIDRVLDVALVQEMNIIIHGQSGTGKTRLASHMIHRELMKHPDRSIRYVNCQSEDVNLQYMNFNDRKYAMDSMIGKDLLILDEVEKVKQRYFPNYILVGRLNKRKQNIIIGNFNQDSLQETYGHHVLSRLARSFWLEIIGSDQRYSKQDEK